MKSLDRDYEEIVHRLGALRPDSRPRWGRLTAHQMVCHLSDGFRMLTDERRSQPLATPLPRPFMRWIALYAPLRWPTGTPTTPELDQTIGGTRPTDFTDDLAKLLALLQRIAAPQHTQFARRHPFFGRMSPAAWRRWAYLHIDHHFRQFGI